MEDDDRSRAQLREDAASDMVGVTHYGVETSRGPSDQTHATARERGMHRGILHPDRRAKPRGGRTRRAPQGAITVVQLHRHPSRKRAPEAAGRMGVGVIRY